MANASEILIAGGVFYLFLGTLTGWWLYSDMKRHNGEGQRYIWGTHRAALGFGFMTLGLAYAMEKLNFTGNQAIVLAWGVNTGLLMVLLGQATLGIRRNPNQIKNPDFIPQLLTGIGDILVTAATGLILYRAIAAFWL